MKHFIKVAFVCAMVLLCCFQSIAQPVVSRVEYFIDTDPGYGSGTAVPLGATPANDLSNLSFSLNIASLSNGVHVVGVRTRDANGVWSHDNKWLFAKIAIENTAVPNISRVEYYLDNDPGYGNGTVIPLGTTGNDLQNLAFTLNISLLDNGVHIVGVRTRDANGVWSHDNKWLFAKVPAESATVPGISRVEYYINIDPGYGNGTLVTTSGSSTDASGSVTLDITNFPIGVSIVGIRTRDANGAWSHDNKWLFAKVPAENAVPNIARVEYYLDTDPGYGNGTPVAITNASNLPGLVINANITGLSSGKHKIFYRTKDVKGAWSHDNVDSFTLSPYNSAPAIVVNSITKTTLCARDSFSVGYHATGTYSSSTIFNVELSAADGSFPATPVVIGSITGNATGGIIKCYLPNHLTDGSAYKIRVNSTGPAITGVSSIYTLTIHDRPYAQSITGDVNVNAGFSYPYSVSVVAGSTWAWIVPAATITQTANSASLLWNTVGQPQPIKVVETSQYGCVGDTSSKNVNVYPLKITDVTPSKLTPCPDEALTVAANAYGVYYSGNIFTAQLSNGTGSFASPVTIGTLTPSPQPLGNAQPITINVKLPFPLANGTNYRIRIVSSNYAKTGDTSAAITVDKPNLGVDKTISKCPVETVDLTTLFTTTGLTTAWDVATPASVQTPGTYRLIVTNSIGCKDTATVTVSNYPQPVPNYTINNTGQCASGNSFVFTNTSTIGAGSMTYQWSFGDNTSSTATSPTHSYAGPGSYTIRLIATSNNGCIDSIKKSVTVYPQPVAAFTINAANQCLNGNAYTFTNTSVISSGSITSYQWTFGDNISSTDASPNHVFLSAGTYNVKVVATSNNGCKDSVTNPVTVYPKPTPNFSINTASQCASGNSFVFTNTSVISSGSMTYVWSFGDNSTSTATGPTHGYVAPGSYTVKLVVTSNNGCKDSISHTVTVYPQPLAGYTINNSSQCVNGNSFDFTNTTTISSGSITSYQWTFGDNTGSTAASPTHVYVSAGSYTVKLVVTSNNGCKDSSSQSVTVNPKPAPAFTINSSTQCLSGNSFVFTNTSTISSGTMTYQWSFGDNTSSTSTSPLHSYTSAGTYSVKVVATSNNGCKDSITQSVTVNPQPAPAFTINSSTQCLSGNGFVFTNTSTISSGTVTYQWSFGDNTTSAATSPSHIYAAAGTYTVKVVATSNNGCKDSSTQSVTVNSQPALGADKSITATCAGGTADITGLYNTSGYSSVTYNTPNAQQAPIGIHRLIVANSSGCTDTAFITVSDASIVTVSTMPNITKMASRECTSADGWTHYYNDNGTPSDFSDDIRLLSIKKNGQNIGTPGNGTFELKVVATQGAGTNHAVLVTNPLVPGGTDFYSMNRYWNITSTSQPATPVAVRFYYNSQDLADVNGDYPAPGIGHGSIQLYKVDGGNPDPTTNWAGATAAHFYTNGSVADANSWVYTNLGNNVNQAEFVVSSFSGGGAGGAALQTLPVTLMQFDAVALADKVNLTWSTATEINTKGFSIQRSLDGRSFETIGQLNAAGNSSIVRNYLFTDAQVMQYNGRLVYYRLMQTDINGQQKLSDVRRVKIGTRSNTLHLQYNPVRNEALLQYQSLQAGKVVVTITDMAGRVVTIKNLSILEGSNQVRLSTSVLAQGMYEVSFITQTDRQHVRMVKE